MKSFKGIVINFLENALSLNDWNRKRNRNQTILTGNFLVFDLKGKVILRVQGRIVERVRMPAEVYIYDPPAFAKSHRHGKCLQLLHPNQLWFKLHFEKPATDFRSAYTYVELFLTEAYNSGH